ncbi:MAG: hypothetical protein ACTSWR_07885 [Candidatus Helarchaeota archaeon]
MKMKMTKNYDLFIYCISTIYKYETRLCRGSLTYYYDVIIICLINILKEVIYK